MKTLRVRDLKGQAVRLFDSGNPSVTALVFLAPECPIANRYAPELARLHEKFSKRGVEFWWVYSGGETSRKEIVAHVESFRLPDRVLLDPDLKLARVAQVRVTPEAAVFSPGGELIYHGRIDDLFVDYGVKRPTPTRRELEETLEATLAGKPPPYATARAVGCFIGGLN